MSDTSPIRTATIIGEFVSSSNVVNTSFYWPDWEQDAEDSAKISPYTIDLSDKLSLGLSGAVAVRPLTLRAYYDISKNDEEQLGLLAGSEFAHAVKTAELLGQFVLQVSLSEANRLHIAGLQLKSPSTPPHLQQACRTFIGQRLKKPVIQ